MTLRLLLALGLAVVAVSATNKWNRIQPTHNRVTTGSAGGDFQPLPDGFIRCEVTLTNIVNLTYTARGHEYTTLFATPLGRARPNGCSIKYAKDANTYMLQAGASTWLATGDYKIWDLGPTLPSEECVVLSTTGTFYAICTPIDSPWYVFNTKNSTWMMLMTPIPQDYRPGAAIVNNSLVQYHSHGGKRGIVYVYQESEMSWHVWAELPFADNGIDEIQQIPEPGNGILLGSSWLNFSDGVTHIQVWSIPLNGVASNPKAWHLGLNEKQLGNKVRLHCGPALCGAWLSDTGYTSTANYVTVDNGVTWFRQESFAPFVNFPVYIGHNTWWTMQNGQYAIGSVDPKQASDGIQWSFPGPVCGRHKMSIGASSTEMVFNQPGGSLYRTTDGLHFSAVMLQSPIPDVGPFYQPETGGWWAENGNGYVGVFDAQFHSKLPQLVRPPQPKAGLYRLMSNAVSDTIIAGMYWTCSSLAGPKDCMPNQMPLAKGLVRPVMMILNYTQFNGQKREHWTQVPVTLSNDQFQLPSAMAHINGWWVVTTCNSSSLVGIQRVHCGVVRSDDLLSNRWSWSTGISYLLAGPSNHLRTYSYPEHSTIAIVANKTIWWSTDNAATFTKQEFPDDIQYTSYLAPRGNSKFATLVVHTVTGQTFSNRGGNLRAWASNLNLQLADVPQFTVLGNITVGYTEADHPCPKLVYQSNM